MNTPRYPSLPQAWIIFVIFLAASLGLGLAIGAISQMAGIGSVSVGNFIGYNLSMIFVIWFAWKNTRDESKGHPIFHFRKIPPLLYLLLIFLTLSFAVILDPLTNLLPMPGFVEELFAMLGTQDVWTFLLVCFTGPVLEELLFRGLILEGFLSRYKPGKAIFWSAFLFGLFHLNPWQFIPGFFIGLILGYVYMQTRSLIPVILIHVVNNTFSYLMLSLFGPDIITFKEMLPEGIDYLILMIASLLVFVLTAFLLFQMIRKNPRPWTFNSPESNSS